MKTKYGFIATKEEGGVLKIDFDNCKFLSAWDLLKFLTDDAIINKVLNNPNN